MESVLEEAKTLEGSTEVGAMDNVRPIRGKSTRPAGCDKALAVMEGAQRTHRLTIIMHKLTI
jgi:hypothetical protein